MTPSRESNSGSRDFDEMVEKAAQALVGGRMNDGSLPPPNRHHFYTARAALEAAGVRDLLAENERLREENNELKDEMLQAAQISSTVRHAREVVAAFPAEFTRLCRENREATERAERAEAAARAFAKALAELAQEACCGQFAEDVLAAYPGWTEEP